MLTKIRFRDFIGDHIHIDGRMIGQKVYYADAYLSVKYGLDREAINAYWDSQPNVCLLLTQILALKQSRWLLYRTSHSCGSLYESLYDLEIRLKDELLKNHGIEFDEDIVNEDNEEMIEDGHQAELE